MRHPKFADPLSAQAHLLTPVWRPESGEYGIPQNSEGMMPFVYQLYNAFLDVSEVYDAHLNSHYAAHFSPGGVWSQNLDDVEAISHIVVSGAVNLHTRGTIGLQFKHMPETLPAPGTPGSRLTFGQRIWYLATLIRHYKIHAESLMRQIRIEDHLVLVFDMLMKHTDFKEKFSARPEYEREVAMREVRELGIPQPLQQNQNVSGNVDIQHIGQGGSAHATERAKELVRQRLAQMAAAGVGSSQHIQANMGNHFHAHSNGFSPQPQGQFGPQIGARGGSQASVDSQGFDPFSGRDHPTLPEQWQMLGSPAPDPTSRSTARAWSLFHSGNEQRSAIGRSYIPGHSTNSGYVQVQDPYHGHYGESGVFVQEPADDASGYH